MKHLVFLSAILVLGSISVNAQESPASEPRFIRSRVHAGSTQTAATLDTDDVYWSALGNGMNSFVTALATGGSELYAGGIFDTAGGLSANRVAKWNGVQWLPLGSGMDSDVFALAVSGSNLYAGGHFTVAGGVSANRIAKWNGTQWAPLGTGMNNDVYTLAVIGSDLYAGGAFTTAGGVSANRIAKWDGTQWLPIGGGLNRAVNALVVIPNGAGGGDLYAGGYFMTAGGDSAKRIAKWNGTQWSPLGSGMDSPVSSLATIPNGTGQSDLYVGGGFTTAGGITVNFVAKWNGAQWSALGSGTGSGVSALAVIGSGLYVGGDFTIAGGVSANRIAKWNGTQWSRLGSGTNEDVTSLAVSGNNLFVGGLFTTAGVTPSSFIARWSRPPTSVEERNATPEKFRLEQNYPNPFNPETNIKYQIPSTGNVMLKLYDMLGREVAMLVNEHKSPGTYTMTWDASGHSSGIYFYRLTAGSFVETKKLVLVR